MPYFEVTIKVGTTREIEAANSDEALELVRRTAIFDQCDIDFSEVIEINPSRWDGEI